ncbi:cytochrome P450 [Nonomuraea mesophila]|uniref:Cytochrome P450 n=1 Tax=Nonomuraea mesophila TaxID=2530382 RepID=A0A4R5FK72_9ACTN|nr:cytochrome P450 [Nonomuraea mesophila]TDE53224.1 cytochrome P450 [Nonomuraea mesophila]
MNDFAASITFDQLGRDPCPIFARLRREAPVVLLPKLDLWMVTRWDDVRQVLSAYESFTSAFPSLATQIFGEGSVLRVEGNAHADLRAAVDTRFAHERIERAATLTREAARPYAGELRSRVELMSSYFEPAASTALARFIGLPDVDTGTLIRWARDLSAGMSNFMADPGVHERALAAATEIRQTIEPCARKAADRPDGSVLSQLLHSGCPSDTVRTVEKIMPTFIEILSAFLEPAAGAGLTLLALLQHPTQMQAVRDDPRLIRKAVHETLRWQSPNGALTRRAAKDVLLAGQIIPAGATVMAVIASAGRDESIFTDPDTFDINRAPFPNLGLGYSRHACLAAPVVGGIITALLDVLLEQHPWLSLDPGQPHNLHGWKFRVLTNLHVRIGDPARGS